MPKRRTKGDGGLSQRHDHPSCPPLAGGQRPAHHCLGRWVGTIDVELPNGRKKRRAYYGRTQAEAKKKLDAARRAKAAGSLVASSPTVAAYLAGWLEKRKQPPKPLKPNTWNGYEQKVRGYIVPALGKKRLDELRPVHIEAMYDDLRARGLAEASVRQTHAILKKALRDAERVGSIGLSPMGKVESPGTDTVDREQWTMAQAVTALRAAGDNPRWWLAIFYGMRQGEVLGLDWSNINWDAHSASIEQTRQHDYGYTGSILGTPKSKASRRVIPLVPQIEVRLRLLWEEQGRPDTGLVFPNSKGGLMDPKRDWLNWRQFIDSATVPPLVPLPLIALHAARNTASSLMEAAGIPVRVVGQIIGQSQVKTTHGYQHAELERMRAYMDGLSDLLQIEA